MARRNRRDPFNPFAPGASNKSQKKVVKQQPVVTKNQSPLVSRKEQLEAMKRKIKLEQERKKESEIEASKVEDPKVEEPKVEEPKVEEPKVEEPKVEVPIVKEPKEVKSKVEKPKVEKSKVGTQKKTNSSETKLDELKRRSEELAAKSGIELPSADYGGSLFSKPKKTENVEKKVAPVVSKKPIRKTKRGGGRQPKQQKLNRRKQLEFRFDAREILNSPEVAEEHRSNLFGQIWAKGERIGTDSAIEYIAEKEQEGIISSAVSEKLEALIKSYSTKR